MRRLIGIILAVAIFATGCGSDSNSASSGGSGDNGNQAKKAYKIALITNDAYDPFYVTMNAGAQDKAKELGVKVSWSAPASLDVAAQTSTLQSVIARKPDAIMMSAIDGHAMVAPIKQATAQGIPVIMLDSDIEDPSARMAFIGSDNVAGGKLAADEMKKLLGDDGKVAYEGYKPGIQSVDNRFKGWKEGLKGTSLTDAGEEYDDADLKKIASNVNALMQRHGDLEGVFASYSNATIGAGNAIQNGGKTGKIKLVGFDASPDQVALLNRGIASALVVQKVYGFGELGVEAIVKYLETKEKPKDQLLDPIVVTKENMNAPEVQPYLYRQAKEKK